MLSAIGVVLLYALAEYLLVRWTQTAVEGRPVVTALYAGFIRALVIVGVLVVVNSPVMGVAAILGDMIGSYLGAREKDEDDDGFEDFDSEEAGSEDSRAGAERTSDGACRYHCQATYLHSGRCVRQANEEG